MKRGFLIAIVLIFILYAILSWLRVFPWTKSPGHSYTYTFTGTFHDPSFPSITINVTPLVPPKALSALPSDYVQVQVTVGTLTFSTDDPQYQCIQGLVPLLFEEELAYPGVFLAVYNNCGSIVDRGPEGLMTISRPLVGASGLYVMFTIPHDSVCSTNASGRRLCLATPPTPVPPTPTPTPPPVPPPTWSVSPTALDASSCSQGPTCTVTLTEDSSSQSGITWTANSDVGATFTPPNGSLSPGGQQQVTISGMACQNGAFTFTGSEGASPLSASWSCTPAPTPPCINVDQPSITLYSLTNSSQTVVFTNCGQDTGTVSIAWDDGKAGWLSASPTSTSLGPGGTSNVTISGNFNSCSTCRSGNTYKGTVTATITTNAGTSAKVVNVTFVVQIG